MVVNVRRWRVHDLVPGMGEGWFVCVCGCGALGVCPGCVPDAPKTIQVLLCEVHRKQARCGVPVGEMVCGGEEGGS